MSYDESIQYLYNLQKHGIKFGLDNIRRLVSELGNPHTLFRTVHVAGTNGKGSTSSMLASILRSAGLTVGLFTSPHLISFTERIRINGTEIDERDVVFLADEIRNVSARIDGLSPTFFEVVTAMALLYFSRQKVDIAVMEVGMGGRLDATNIIIPDVCVITQIGYDHTDFLGSTLAEIAEQKAGIIKNGIPVVSAHQQPEVANILSATAKAREAPLYTYGRDFSSRPVLSDARWLQFHYQDEHLQIEDLALPLVGAHQMENASLAIKAACLSDIPLDVKAIKDGLKKTVWPGRLEFINHDPPILIDGAHNPSAAVVLSQALQDIFMKTYKTIILIVGVMADKDIEGILKPFLPFSGYLILTSPSSARAASPENLFRVAESLGFGRVRITYSVQEALAAGIREARILASESPLIVVTGSFYTIGEAKEALGQKGVLRTLSE